MPSASPESRSRRRRHSRSRSGSRSPKTVKHSKVDKESNRYPTDRSKRRSQERNVAPLGHPKRDRSTDRHKRSKSEERSSRTRVRRQTPDRDDQSYRGRRHQTSRFEMVRVKEEPPSDNEGERRRNRGRREHGRQARTIKREREDFFRPDGASGSAEAEVEQPKDKPNFGLSGKLAEDTNVYNGIVIKYNEPIEARKPNKKWRLYPFKGDQPLPMLPIHRQSAYLLGRERRVADIPIDHPSCSKQHSVLQFRMVPYKREDGSSGRRVRPYIIDLESANGTFVNNNKIEPKRYVELMEKDVLKFGFSSREYVLLHEGSAGHEDEVDLPEEPPAAVQST